MTKRVYVSSNEIPESALAIVRGVADVRTRAPDGPPTRGELLSEVAGADGLFCLLTERVDEELLERARDLTIVSSMSVGFDHVDLAAATRRGVMVTNTPGVLTEAVADATFGLILGLARRIAEGDRFLREGKWRVKWSPMMMVGRDVHGKTLGVYGMGRIGSAVARRAKGFGMRIIYHNRERDPAAERELGAEFRSMDELLGESDFLTVHVPLGPDTRNSVGARELSLMKRTAYIVNTSRGGVVREESLVEALRAGAIAGAALDVFESEPLPPDSPLLSMRNVVLTPHLASASIESRTAMAVLAARNLEAGLTGGRPPNLLNPEVWGVGPKRDALRGDL